MQVQLTQEAKIATDFFFIGAIFAFVGFVSALGGEAQRASPLFAPTRFSQQGAFPKFFACFQKKFDILSAPLPIARAFAEKNKTK